MACSLACPRSATRAPSPAASMNDSPLNLSNVGYDFACNQDLVTSECTGETQVHADGEIWSATNFSLREALVAKHGA